MDKFVVKEKKNNPNLAVNIMQEVEIEINMPQECFILTLLSCFNQLANGAIFLAEFCVFALQEEISFITNFTCNAQKQGQTCCKQVNLI